MKNLPIALTFVLLSVVPLLAAEGDWKVGLASVKITPPKPVRMAGYGGRLKPFDGVTQDLHAKALALQDSTGQKAVLVTTDLESIAGPIADEIRARITAKTGLQPAQTLLNWSHTHAGPYLSLDAKPEPGVTLEDAQNTVEYTRFLQAKIVEVVEQALGKLEPAKLSLGAGVATFVMNRREFTTNGVILGVNPRGLVDRSVPVLRIDSPDGRMRAVLFGAACHNTTLGAKNFSVCGDYAGFAQEQVEKQYPGVQAMFMSGCGANANPYPRDTWEWTRAHGTNLGTEVCRVLETKLRPIRGPLKVAFDYANLPLQAATQEEIEKIAASKARGVSYNAPQMLAMLKRGEKLPASYPAPMAVWQFGNDFTMVSLSGEVVAEYVPMIERALGPLQLWIASYSHDDFGYLPSANIIEEGGYETRGLNRGDGWFARDAQDVLVAKVKELAEKVGRKK